MAEDIKSTDPIRTSQEAMRPQLPKRFYTDVSVEAADGGLEVRLDGRAVKTPGRNSVVVGKDAIAQRLAAEFDAQTDRIDPKAMPLYRLINTALDGVATDLQAVREDIIRFAGSDLLCYRADAPDGLVASQSAHWDGPLDWINGLIGARFTLAEGIVHVQQPKPVIAAFGVFVAQYENPLELAALHSMTSLMGSAILALAVAKAELTPDEGWAAAHVDEDWNIAQWGEDAEAKAMRAARRRELDAAASVFG